MNSVTIFWQGKAKSEKGSPIVPVIAGYDPQSVQSWILRHFNAMKQIAAQGRNDSFDWAYRAFRHVAPFRWDDIAGQRGTIPYSA